MNASALALVALLFAAGCDKGDKPAPSSSSPSTAGAASTGGGSSTPEIKVLDAGKAPKATLRFAPQKDAKQSIVMAMDMGMTMDLGGGARSQQMPTTEMTMDVSITDIAANGDIRYRFELTKIDVLESGGNAALVDAMKTALTGMTGLSGTAHVTNRGFTKDMTVNVPAGVNPQISQFLDSLKQSFSQLTAPLPEEAVGLGAKWDTSTRITQNGMTMTQVASNEIVALDGNVLTLAIKLSQTAPRQTIKKDGMTADLERYTGSGTGETTINLGQVVPTKAKISMKNDMDLKSAGQSLGIGINAVITMTAK